ncbi:MAG: hypothetical protein DRI24_18725 [Deltaproteobacteria bacterium]|nr:MAG: hypothetical protein DRI24_18725 [Deltaproteobacteria bacterium]
MADQVYLIPGVGLYKDTGQDSVKLIPGGGLYKEQSGAEPPSENWAHTINTILAANIDSINGVSISNIQSVNGVE